MLRLHSFDSHVCATCSRSVCGHSSPSLSRRCCCLLATSACGVTRKLLQWRRLLRPRRHRQRQQKRLRRKKRCSNWKGRGAAAGCVAVRLQVVVASRPARSAARGVSWRSVPASSAALRKTSISSAPTSGSARRRAAVTIVSRRAPRAAADGQYGPSNRVPLDILQPL